MIQYLLFSLFIHIQGEGKTISETTKKIQETNENLQEEEKKYLRKQNVDHHSDAVSNKTIEKYVDKYSIKCAEESRYIVGQSHGSQRKRVKIA